jgi:sugar O-acyltransferase (sialic acid O-acetyltransferase NeuD family)
MANVIVFGAGPIAQVARFYLDRDSEHRVVGFTVDEDRRTSTDFDGLPVAGWQEIVSRFPPDAFKLFIPIGYGKVNLARKERFLAAKALGYGLVSFVHPRAYYYGTPVGENAFILEANVIQPFSEIGDNVTLWSGNHIGHHSRIGDHCFISSHVVISGNVTVGERCFIGVNATVRDNVKLGAACVIGSGALVTSDLADESVITPAESSLSRVPSSRLRKI